MTVGALLDALAKLDPDTSFTITDSVMPYLDGDWYSYRGYYDELALQYSNVDKGFNTVGALRRILQAALGGTLYGYKGGEYTVTKWTRVWIATWGAADGRTVGRPIELHGQWYLPVAEHDGDGDWWEEDPNA